MLKVAVGTAIVAEQPISRLGVPIAAAEPGWYVLRDHPALSGTDIVDPRQEQDEFGRPTVTFGFTKEGRVAFQQVTRRIAQRGRAQAIGPVSEQAAEQISGHLALILDSEVKTRPIINFAEFPMGSMAEPVLSSPEASQIVAKRATLR